LIDVAADVVETGGEMDGARGAAGGGDDAEGAAIAAAVLHFKVRASLMGVGGEGESGELGVGEGVVVEDFAEGDKSRGFTDARRDKANRRFRFRKDYAT
jgi:hypothetical protein